MNVGYTNQYDNHLNVSKFDITLFVRDSKFTYYNMDEYFRFAQDMLFIYK